MDRFLTLKTIYKMHKIKLIFILLVISFNIYSQELKFSVNLGCGSYKLEELKELQERISNEVAEAVISFPSNIYYAASVEILFDNKHAIGLSYDYYFTGGRNHVKDYSGEYKLDIQTHAYRVGVKYMCQLTLADEFPLRIALGVQAGLVLSDLIIDESLIIHNYLDNSSDYDLKYHSLFVEPLLTVTYPISNNFALEMKVAYELDSENEFEKLYSDDQDHGIRCDWSGIRAQIGIAYYIDL